MTKRKEKVRKLGWVHYPVRDSSNLTPLLGRELRMGGQESTLVVRTEQLGYYCGDLVQGTVFMNVVSGIRCNALKLTVLGEETAHWTSNSGNGGNTTITKFLEVKVSVHNFGGHVAKGQYSFPFSFVLPANIPGSLNMECSRRSGRGVIAYTIRGQCEVDSAFASNMRCTHPFEIREHFNPRLLPPVSTSQSVRVQSMGIINKGDVLISMTVNQGCFIVGSTVMVSCQVDNRSKVDLQGVALLLVRTVSLRSRHGSHRWTEEITRTAHAGPNKGTQMAMQMQLNIPPILAPSVRSRMVDCAYHVVLEMQSRGVFKKRVSAQQGIVIFPPQRVGSMAPPPPKYDVPPGWSPHVFAATEIKIPTPTDLPPSYDIATGPEAPPPAPHYPFPHPHPHPHTHGPPPAAAAAAPPGYPPSSYPPSAYPPGAYPPSSYPPGAYPPYPPSAYPSAPYPPSAYPPAPYPPSAYPPAPYPSSDGAAAAAHAYPGSVVGGHHGVPAHGYAPAVVADGAGSATTGGMAAPGGRCEHVDLTSHANAAPAYEVGNETKGDIEV